MAHKVVNNDGTAEYIYIVAGIFEVPDASDSLGVTSEMRLLWEDCKWRWAPRSIQVDMFSPPWGYERLFYGTL